MSDLDLRSFLTLERLEVNLFRGVTPRSRTESRIFGGQVIAQSLLAAYETVEDRLCHSLHCYFIRPGDPTVPIIFEVDRSRDGKSFTTRRVVAIQHGRQIFNLAASFQVPEKGFEHQSEMPAVGPPDGLPEIADLEAELMRKLPEDQRTPIRDRPIEMRFLDVRINEAPGQKMSPTMRAWFRIRVPLGDDPRMHQAALAYASDMALLSVSGRPHGLHFGMEGAQIASLDHAMWFHRPTNANEWHLYDMDSPSASAARGFNRGSIFRADGALAASCVQEGLIRLRDPK